MTDQTSELLYMRAKLRLPGGVNSPVRAYQAVGRTPRFIQSAKGSHITDVDGNEMIDYVCSWGPGILGHADPRVIEKVKAALIRFNPLKCGLLMHPVSFNHPKISSILFRFRILISYPE